MDETREVNLYVNVANRIIAPKDSDLTNEIISMCHQGNHMHRSCKETVEEFRKHFTIQEMNMKKERAPQVKTLLIVVYQNKNGSIDIKTNVVHDVCDEAI